MIEVVAAIIRREGKILITRRFDDVHLPGLWEFPGGKVEPGESRQAALEREIAEEIDVRIRVGGQFLSLEHHYPEKSVRLHFYDCALIEGEPRRLQVADVRWVDPDELDQFQFPAADTELIAALRSP